MTADFVVEHSRPEAERAGTRLVLMLHGFSSNEQDLMGLVPALPAEGFTYAALRAPEDSGMGEGYRWYPLDQRIGYDLDAVAAGVDYAADWIRQNADQYSQVILLGFSQGMSIALGAARALPETVAAVVGLSGFVTEETVAGQDAALAERSPRLPVFYGRGQEDTAIPEEYVARTLDWLRDHAEATKVVYAGLGHAISNQEAGHVAEFLKHVVK